MERKAIKLLTTIQEKNHISNKLNKNASLLEHALYYQSLGWSVVPVQLGKKIPFVKWKPYQSRRPTLKQIRKWWEKFPDANIGIITGKISNLVVLDFDSILALETFRNQICLTPKTIKQKTGRGYQYFFPYPNGRDIRNKSGLMKDVDLRAEAGLVVVAPSIHKSGKRYEWKNHDPLEDGLKGLKEIPKKILIFCLKGSKSSISNKIAKDVNILDGVEEGIRDETLFKHACSLKSKGLSRAEVEIIITEAAKNCSPPFPKDEALAKVESAFGYPDSNALKIRRAREKMRKRTSKKGITVRRLMRTKFPEPKWALKGVFCEGLNILAGKPKVGKSFLALNICVAIAHGELALNEFETEKSSVLFIGLEDTLRRLKGRLRVNIPSKISKATTKMRLINEWPRMGDGGLDLLEEEIKKYTDLRLIVIDTLQWFRPTGQNKDSNSYAKDYEQMMVIKQLADKHRIAILLIHHLRKTGADDIFDTLSGSFGLTGGADGLLALEDKNGKFILHIRGRDIDEQQYAMKFAPSNLSWSVIGDADEVKATNKQQLLYDAVKNADGPISPKQLIEETGLNENYVHKNMIKLVDSGDVKKLDRGKYQFIQKGPEK
jgi:hypothetical protein